MAGSVGEAADARPGDRFAVANPGLPRHEHELGGVVLERPLVEPAVERFDLESRDVDQTVPFGLRRPPEPDRRAVVADDVDAVVGVRVPDRVTDSLALLVLPVEKMLA